MKQSKGANILISELKIKLILLVIFSITGISLTFQMANKKYEQVPSTFLSEFAANSLRTVSTQAMKCSKRLGCQSLCSSTTNCSLACYNDSTCFLSSALVTKYWKPLNSPSQSLLAFPDYKCFSSWTFENDLTTKIVNTSVSSTLSDSWSKSYAIDGYYVDAYFKQFSSFQESNAWFQIDMGYSYSISMIVVKIWQNTVDRRSHFTNVEGRVGNSSATGNFNSNALLRNFNDTAVQGQFVIFKRETPIVGRYISLQQFPNDYFVLGN